MNDLGFSSASFLFLEKNENLCFWDYADKAF